jgi:hypothetical protein
MNFRVQQLTLGSLALAVSLLTASCTSTKVAQCAKTISVVNQTAIDTKTISNSGTKGDLQTIEQLVGIFDKAAKDLDGVTVSDEKLNVYKGQFLGMYKGSADVTKQLIGSIKDKKLTKVHEGLRKYAAVVSPERDLVAGINQYCQEPETK